MAKLLQEVLKEIPDPTKIINVAGVIVKIVLEIKERLEQLKIADATKTRIIDTAEFMLCTLNNIKVYKNDQTLKDLHENLDEAKNMCEIITKNYEKKFKHGMLLLLKKILKKLQHI